MKPIRIVSIAVFAVTVIWAQTAFPPSGGASSGGGSTFTGSTAATSTCGATPTFSLADVSVKSPEVITCTLSATVTSVNISNPSAGARFSLSWIQPGSGGPYPVSYGGSAVNTCPVVLLASITTTQQFEIQPDGTTVKGTGCSNDLAGVSVSGPAMAAITATAAGQVTCTFDNVSYTDVCYGNNDGVRKAVPRVASGNQMAATDLSNGAIGTGAVCLAVGGCSGGAYAASAVSNGTVNQTGSIISLVSIANVPAMAASACRHFNVISDQATGGYNLYIYVDGSQIAQIYNSGGSGWTVFQELSYCNGFGVQNAQKLYQRPSDSFHGGAFNYEFSPAAGPAGAPSQVPTAVDWSSSHTVALYSVGTNGTPLAGVLRIAD